MDSKEMQGAYAPRQLGDSHTLSFPRPGELAAVYFAPLPSALRGQPEPDVYTD